MKNLIKYVLQKILGLPRYLYLFARFKIQTIRKDSKESAFFSFVKLIKKDGALLDIGANLGVMSYHFSRCFPDRQVYAFEPVPLNIRVLEKILAKYKLANVRLEKIALGNVSGDLEMILPEEKSVTLHGLAHVVHDTITEYNSGKRFTVACKSLDDWCGEEGVKAVAAIKLDVENFETFVLQGASQILQRDRPVIYSELWDNDNRTKCFSFLENMGYKTMCVINDRVEPFDPAVYRGQNFIFVP